ncbi:hypothetical protein AWN88_14260 [Agrobacterium tumefaciens]|nr:hypothetical protein AWN88_14260 [Agrobacterium tumefaciens]KAJ34043.1 hypothetical protein BW45_06100 [Agrobacterium tumefaciens]
MSEWNAISILPGLKLRSPIEAGVAAIVPSDDPRLLELRSESKKLNKFLGSFTDAFRDGVDPSVIIYKKDIAPSLTTAEAIAGLRDSAALSMVIHNRSLEIKHPGQHRAAYSNAFAIYPWMIDKADSHLIALTPAFWGTHLVSKFKGQSSPEVPIADVGDFDFDQALLSELLRRWHSRFSSEKPLYADRVLFRSLNMANQASLTPGGVDATLYDYGRLIALWVSAFEILAHPPNGDSSYKVVYQQIESAKWMSRRLRWKKWVAVEGRTRPKKHRYSLPIWLCNHLYKARNDFLHGNEVTAKSLSIKNSKSSLFQVAAPLYRMALTSFLELEWKGHIPPISNVDGFASAFNDRYSFMGDQRVVEDALLASVGKLPRGVTSRRRAGTVRRRD